MSVEGATENRWSTGTIPIAAEPGENSGLRQVQGIMVGFKLTGVISAAWPIRVLWVHGRLMEIGKAGGMLQRASVKR